MKHIITFLFVHLILGISILNAQSFTEFEVAEGSDTTFGTSIAFDGINYCFPVQGDQSGCDKITVQFVSQSGNLVGSRISLETEGRNPLIAFDGTNYLAVWNDFDSKLYGQFISPSGALSGNAFVIADYGWIGFGCLIYADTTYMAIYESTGFIITAQRISKSGSLLGNPVAVSSSPGHLDGAMAYDGNNILIGWRGTDQDAHLVFGQLISPSGSLIGSNIIFDDSSFPSDNPLGIAFDGTRFLVCFMDEVDQAQGVWGIYGRFVSTSGELQERITISDNSNSNFPFIAFDGSNFLITWHEIIDIFNEWYLKGQYFNTSGEPVGSPFTIAGPSGSKVPLGGVMLYDGNEFLVGLNKVVVEFSGDEIVFTDGDVYGVFVPNTVNDMNDGSPVELKEYELFQNYPNPFNPVTKISWQSPAGGLQTIKVYDLLGREVVTLINEEKPAGTYEINFDASGLASGVYYYTISAGNFRAAKKMVLTK